MTDESSRLIEWLLRSTVFLTVAWLIVWSLLRVFRLQSVRWQTLAWFTVLVQAALIIPMGIEIPVRVPLAGLTPVKGNSVPGLPVLTLISNHAAMQFDKAMASTDVVLSHSDPKLAVSDSVSGSDFKTEMPGTADPVPVVAGSRDAGAFVPSVVEILTGIWLTGVIVSIGWMFLSYARFLRRLPAAGECPDSWEVAWSAVQDLSNSARRTIRMHVTSELGPAIFWMPGGCRLLIPRDRWAPLSDAQRECVMRHEFAHWQRGDLWRMVAFRAIASLQWFNPLAWSAARRLEECAEWACDDFAQSSHEADSPDYVRALLEFSIVPNCVPAPVPSASGHSLVRRARRILTPAPRKDSKMKKLTLAVITTAVIAAHAVTFKLVAEETEKPVGTQAAFPANADQKPATDTPARVQYPFYTLRGPTSGDKAPASSSAPLSPQVDVSPQVLNYGVPVTSEATVTIPPGFFDGISINVPALGPGLTLNDDGLISFMKGVTITPIPGVGGPGPGVLPSAAVRQVKDVGVAILQQLQAGEAPESVEARAERLRAQGGTREAVIDMAHVFRNDPEFERLRTEMLRDLKIADAKIKLEAAQLAIAGKPSEALTGEEAKTLQLQLMKRRGQFELECKMARDRMVLKESEICLTVYRRVRKAIAEHAKENGIHIVRRASMQSEQERQMNSGDPKSIMQALNHEVVYVADDTLDITEEVLARLKAQSATDAKAAPDAAGNPAALPVRN